MAKQAKYDLLSKKPSRRLDFDDLLIEALHLFQEQNEVREKYQRHFQFILIDETQDTSAIQWEISRIIAASHRNIFIVGDVGQAIYSFRGCSPEATVGQYAGAYPNGEIIRLPTNYRSSATIVRLANELIGRSGIEAQYRLEMKSVHAEGAYPNLREYESADDEAKSIAKTLKMLQAEGRQLHDCAVLFRTNAYSRALEEAFVANGVPYIMEGALGFYGRKEIRDLIAFLLLSVERDSPAADEAVKRILNVPSKSYGKPTHQLGSSFLTQLELRSAKEGCSIYRILATGQFKTWQGIAVKDFRDIIRDVAMAGDTAIERLRKARELAYDDWLLREEGDYEEEGNSRLDNLEELCEASKAFPTASDFLAFVAAQNKATETVPTGDAIEMMTVHRAKGLEWPIVFIAGFAFGMIPHHRSLRWFDPDKTQLNPESIEEERRLAYVALTRAKEQAYISWPLQHQTRSLQRSPFLSEMPSLSEQEIEKCVFEDDDETPAVVSSQTAP